PADVARLSATAAVARRGSHLRAHSRGLPTASGTGRATHPGCGGQDALVAPRRLLPSEAQGVLRRAAELLAGRGSILRPPPRPADRDRRPGALPGRGRTHRPARAARPRRAQGRPGFPPRLAGDAEILAVRPRAADVQFADLLGVSRPRDL